MRYNDIAAVHAIAREDGQGASDAIVFWKHVLENPPLAVKQSVEAASWLRRLSVDLASLESCLSGKGGDMQDTFDVFHENWEEDAKILDQQAREESKQGAAVDAD